jgi:hypothetical protein
MQMLRKLIRETRRAATREYYTKSKLLQRRDPDNFGVLLRRIDFFQSLKARLELVSDIKFGWSISAISREQGLKLMELLLARIVSQNESVPVEMWDNWLYLLAMDPAQRRPMIKSLKFFEAPPNFVEIGKQKCVPKILSITIPILQTGKSNAPIDSLFSYLLKFVKEESEMDILIINYMHLEKKLRSSNCWHILMDNYFQRFYPSFENSIKIIQTMVDDDIYMSPKLGKVVGSHLCNLLKKNDGTALKLLESSMRREMHGVYDIYLGKFN